MRRQLLSEVGAPDLDTSTAKGRPRYASSNTNGDVSVRIVSK
jgi:hypothetical protein